MAAVVTPVPTLYINNLNDKIKKEEIAAQLLGLFATYGRVIDIRAQKGAKMKGQAFLSFAELTEATSALRACEGMLFYDKPLRITYAKSKAHAVRRREDPDFIPANSVDARSRLQDGVSAMSLETLQKRSREDDEEVGARTQKRERPSGDDGDDDDEMELEDEDEAGEKQKEGAIPPVQSRPSTKLLCTNLPSEVDNSVLSVLFQQYQGFLSAKISPSTQPNAAGQQSKLAQVLFESAEFASIAKEAVDGFTLKKGWKMSVAYC